MLYEVITLGAAAQQSERRPDHERKQGGPAIVAHREQRLARQGLGAVRPDDEPISYNFV